MKRALLSLAALAFVPGFAHAQMGQIAQPPPLPFGPPVVDANTAINPNNIDLGCVNGESRAGLSRNTPTTRRPTSTSPTISAAAPAAM